MQEMLEALTGSGVQHRLGSLWPIRLPRQALYTLRVKGMDNVTDGLDGTAHQLRNRLWRQLTGTGENDVGTTDPKASAVRRSASNCRRSSSVKGRIKIGGFIAQVYHRKSYCIKAPVGMH
jgi:hypothetical protein